MTSWRPAAAAAFVFALASLMLFHGFLQHDPSQVVLAELEPKAETRWDRLAVFDLHFVAGMTARNAYTLVEKPRELFELEQCHPQHGALALGEPMVAQGILGIPGYLLSGDPLVIFNSVVILGTLLGAFALYLLVSEWTEVPAAGIAAGILYGFHLIKMGDTVHFFVWDMAWTALVLVFLQRLFVAPRWRDAIGLTLAGGMQIVGSIYPMLAGVLIGAPVFIALALRHGVRNIPFAHLGVAAFCGLVLGVAMYSPYLELRGEGTLSASQFYAYFAYAWMAPGERFDLGIALPLLAVVALALWRRGADTARLLTWPVFCMAVLIALISSGGTSGDLLQALANGTPTNLPEIFNPWPVLLSFVPGLDVVRSPGALFSGVHFALCLLAGFGTAALVRSAPEHRALMVGGVLVALCFIDTLRPAVLGMTPRINYAAVALAPAPEMLTALEEVAARGNDGPLFEVWLDEPQNLSVKSRNAEGALLTAYHHRRSSACYNSFMGAQFDELERLKRALGEPLAIRRLRELGFTTIVVHHGTMSSASSTRLEGIDAHATGERILERLHEGSRFTIYAILAG